MFVVSVIDLEEAETRMLTFADHPLLHEYADVFPDGILGMPIQRDIDFWVNLVPGTKLISRAPYRMTTQELSELKLQLEEWYFTRSRGVH